MKYLFLIFIFFLESCDSKKNNYLVIPENYKNDFSCSVAINDKNSTAIFTFKLNLNENTIINWNKENVEINYSEYTWSVYLESSNTELGYYYFKHKGKQINGKYKALFKAGQVSIFRNGDYVMDYDEPNKPTINIVAGEIILSVNDIKLYNILFNSNSKYANFWVMESQKKHRVCKTIINKIE